MRLPALAAAAILLAAACGQDSGPDPELEKLRKKREAEIELMKKATQPKPPEPPKPPPDKAELVAKCKQQDAVACQGACALDDFESCHLMGLAYEEARGVPTDYDAARRFHIRACEGGFGQGCYAAGIFYDYGKSVPKNPRKAQEYFKKACELKIDAACKEVEK
jgi:TPR repeat protein